MNTAEVTIPNGQLYRPNFYATCKTIGVVYYMKCDCQAFYIGKTKGPFFHQIRDHVSHIKKKMETPISRHMGLYHAFDVLKMKFFASSSQS